MLIGSLRIYSLSIILIHYDSASIQYQYRKLGIVAKPVRTWPRKVSTKMWRVVRVSPGEFWSWPFAKLCPLSRLFVRLLQRSSSHVTNRLTAQERASWKRLSDSTTTTTSAYIRHNTKVLLTCLICDLIFHSKQSYDSCNTSN
jgi:hypothetical protein